MKGMNSATLQLFYDRKIAELENYKNSYLKTQKEWKRFVNGANDIDPRIVPEEILAAWVRCRHWGLDPFIIPQKTILTGEALHALLEKNNKFIEASRPFLTNLYQFLEGSGFHVILFDREGYLLEILGDHDFAHILRDTGGVVGALWSEPSAGHNASGTVVAAKKPAQIFGSQHYLKPYHGSTGCGAPIFSPEGAFLGGITLNAANYRINRHTLGLAVAAAHAIENELRSRESFTQCQRAYQYQQTVIASTMEAMIALDKNWAVSLINEPARKLFALTDARPEGMAIRDVILETNAMLLELIESSDHVTDSEVRIFSGGAWNDYTVTITPILSSENSGIGKVIAINEITRAKTMVAKMVGARAVFQFEDMCGRNPGFLLVKEQAKMVAQNDSNVLLLGRSGTGKDIFAQSIHNASRRRNGPYVAINCAAIPRDLVANELFGHEEGAFTGSRRGGNQGKFELADGGTVFLDEIAEMPLDLQAVLLRVIEDKSITRIGGKLVRQIDVRIITATNKSLRDEMEKGNFREDLFFRLNVFGIEMVPLHERPDDIPLLMQRFIEKYEHILGKKIKNVDKRVLAALEDYHWPGNIRELQNVIERMMNFSTSNELTWELLPKDIIQLGKRPDPIAHFESSEEREKRIIKQMLDLKFNKQQIAEKLNISRATIYRKIKKFAL